MKSDLQRIALMKSLGWIDLHVNYEPWEAWRKKWWHGKLVGVPPTNRHNPQETRFNELPPLSLDLMHEAEKTLTNDEWAVYMAFLVRLCDTRAASATKEQRLEAYLRVKGLWREEP